jgi:hypothetical protein
MARSAAEVMEAALPDAKERDVVLRQLLRSADIANRIASSAWAVSLLDAGFRLNVGQVEALALFDDTIRVLLAAPQGDARLVGLQVLGTTYKSVRGSQSAFVGSIPEFTAAWSVLEPLHVAYIEDASTTSTGRPRSGTPFARFMSDPLMQYAAAQTATQQPMPAQSFPPYDFKVGETYARRDIFKVVGVEDHTGGPWFTGYAPHGPDWFVFCGVCTRGRTGHDYNNHFVGDHLVWFAKGPSNGGTRRSRT